MLARGAEGCRLRKERSAVPTLPKWVRASALEDEFRSFLSDSLDLFFVSLTAQLHRFRIKDERCKVVGIVVGTREGEAVAECVRLEGSVRRPAVGSPHSF